ncbi:pts system lactose-specific transporter subunit EIIBC [Streptococcus pneumoniae]|nr:pts system lactose-specific transporter subunit EIIBC [Streptococcus pneumoniae]
MDKLVAAIEKQQGKFEKISTNNYMMAIKDGFIATMPLTPIIHPKSKNHPESLP